MKEYPKHVHIPRPGETKCFVCGVDTWDAARADLGLPPLSDKEHEPVEREYGPDQMGSSVAAAE